MPINPQSSARIDEFLNELKRNNMNASHYSRSVYRINQRRVSIRTTTKPGPEYWYDISESILHEVDYFIYQMDSPSHFVLLPSSFFEECYASLKDSNRPNAKQFYINWRQNTLLSKPNFKADIKNYSCSTLPKENYGIWKNVFGVK